MINHCFYFFFGVYILIIDSFIINHYIKKEDLTEIIMATTKDIVKWLRLQQMRILQLKRGDKDAF